MQFDKFNWSNNIFRIVAIAMLALNAVFAYAGIKDVVQSAHRLITQDQAEQALELLRPEVLHHAGQKDFDYVYALSLVGTQRYAQAEFVFERLLAENPAFHGARLDLAHTYLALGRYRKASAQLDMLADTSPPKNAVAAIAKMRQQINTERRSLRLSRYINLNTAVGYDSNVNSGTVIENFLGFDLDERSREIDSDYVEISAKGAVILELRPDLKLSARLSFGHRHNSQADFIDTQVISASTALAKNDELGYRVINLSVYGLNIDGDNNSTGAMLSGVWTRPVSDQWRLGSVAGLGRIAYEDALSIKDVIRSSIGVTASFRASQQSPLGVSMRIGFGHDDPVESASRYARNYFSLSSNVGWTFTSNLRGTVSMLVQESRYDDVFFEQRYEREREDTFYKVMANVQWDFRESWQLNQSLSYTRNDTFVDIFEYEKFDAKVSFNYLFQ